jgi:hypothetical protein
MTAGGVTDNNERLGRKAMAPRDLRALLQMTPMPYWATTTLIGEPRSRGAFFARVNGNRPGFTETRLRGWACKMGYRGWSPRLAGR